MERIKLLDYQLKAIKNRISASYEEIEDALLEKYEVFSLEDLNATDYDKILDDISERHKEITADLVGQ